MQNTLIPLSKHQQAIWLEALLYPDRPIFNIGTYVLLNGIPDTKTLEKAIQNVIAQKDALRMQVVRDGSEAKVIFKKRIDFQLKVQAFDSQHEAKAWMDTNFTQSIAIDAEVLFDIQLVTFAKQSYLYLKHHHIYIDGWGRAQLVKAIAEQYNAIIEETEVKHLYSYETYLENIVTKHNASSERYWQESFDASFERSALFDPLKDGMALPSKRLVSQWKSTCFYHPEFNQKELFYQQLAALASTFAITRAQEEITIGIPLLNRFNETELNTLGYFVGLIPLRIQIPKDIPFSELVTYIKTKFRETRDHRHLSIQEINKAIGMQSTDFHQAYDVVFSFEPHDHHCSFGTINSIEAGTFSSDFEQNPIVIHAQQFIEPDVVDFIWDYNLKYNNPETINRLSKRFERVLNHVNTHPDSLLSEIPISDADEQNALVQFAQGEHQPLHYASVFEWMQQSVPKDEEVPILFDESRQFSRAEINSEAQRIAGALQQFDFNKNNHVAIHMDRSAEVIIAMAGCICAGVPYVYINPELGRERKKHMLKDANVAAIISTSRTNFGLPEVDLWSNEAFDWKLPKTQSQDPIYALFTSGSTGLPKGVSIPNEGIVNLIQELQSSFLKNTDARSRLALVSSFSFDASVQFIYAHLCLGLPLHIVPETARKDGRELAQFFTDHEITHTDGVPVHLTSLHLRNNAVPENFKTDNFLIGGEAMQLEQIAHFMQWMDRPVKVTNAYGPTECSVDATLFHFDETTFKTLKEIPIGRPVANSEMHLLDPRGISVPLGEKGEIYIGGSGLAVAYLNKPELTKASFIHHPTYGGLYKTGDIGSWLENGNLICLGRKDHQVKLRGFRIELGEIEAVLTHISNIEDAAVFVRETNKNKSLVAVVQSQDKLNEAVIIDELLQSLPEYMIPTLFHRMEALPRLNSGKIDRKALEQLNFNTQDDQPSHPETETEKTVAVVVSALLDIELPNVTQGFYALGGDSLLLVYLITELEETFNVELPVHQIADRNSIREIATFLDHKREEDSPEIHLDTAVTEALHWDFPKELPPKSSGSTALITGVTGFIGAFLLQEILDRFDTVYCLIRSSSELHAHLRLKSVAESYDLDVNTADKRIRYLYGNLSSTRLGLSDATWDTLCSDVDTIYHSGAEVHFMKNANTMYAANVGGTSELLRMSCTTTLKSFHFISTVGIFNESDKTIVETQDISEQIHDGKRGYETTKWIAEGCVLEAQKRGIPASIYRLARITGHSNSGIANYDDFFHRFILGCIDLGVFPEVLVDKDTDLTPIDTTIKSIVALSDLDEGQLYHLVNPNRMSYATLLARLEKEGNPLQIVSTDAFIKLAVENCRTAAHPLYTILPILKQKSWFTVNSKRFGTENTLVHLKHQGIVWPEASHLVDVYIKQLLQKKQLWNETNHKTQ